MELVDAVLGYVFDLFLGGLGDDVGVVDAYRVGVDVAWMGEGVPRSSPM